MLTGYGRGYTYDASGRMTTYEGVGQTVNSNFPGHAIKNSGYTYDENGNVKTRSNGQTLTWNDENRLSAVTGGGVNDYYWYDADGQRVRKLSGGIITYYPNQYYETYAGSVDKYYYFNGQPIALRRNGTIYYMHQDQIGNLALVTSGGTRVDDQGFYAYGRLRRGIIGVERSFTGQQKDFSSGLIYMNARYYDPEIGQFLSPDTLVPDPVNLFDYNRYMYVRGNPMMYNDPTGHYSNDEIKQYLQDNYGDAWQDYWQAWQADPYWMWVLGAAHDNYTLITGLGGSVKFTAKAGSFALSHGQLHEYQGQGVYTVLDDNTGVVGDSEWLGYGSESGVWGIFTQLFRQGMYQYYQPIYNYSGGSPSFSHWQMITVNNSVEANILAGDNTPYLLGAIGEAIKRRWPQALGGAVGAGLQVWSVYTTIDDLAVYKADSVQYQSVGQYWQSPGVSADGKPVPVPAPHPWANPNGPQWPGPLE